MALRGIEQGTEYIKLNNDQNTFQNVLIYQTVTIKRPPSKSAPLEFRFSERGSETRTPHFGEIQKVKRAPPSPPQAEKF